MTDNELAIDWVRLQNENYLLQLDLYRERTAHVITTVLLIIETVLLFWIVLK